jgi:ABC-type uncharacterized transport system ATPase subunit
VVFYHYFTHYFINLTFLSVKTIMTFIRFVHRFKFLCKYVTLTFGGLNALSDVDMTIEPGLITSIIGPNGAGKTSMLNCISGFYHPTTGRDPIR